MNPLLLLIAAFSAANAIAFFDVAQEQWNTFKVMYNKRYNSGAEENFRMNVFLVNSYEVAEHNAKYAQGLVSFKAGTNKYSDMLHDEFVRTMNGFNRSLGNIPKNNYGVDHVTYIEPANVVLPDSVDWRNQGAVTPVKDQGACGSCWSFSTTGSLEGQHFRKTKKLISLSEQNLIDCSGRFGNYGCNGGFTDSAFKYIEYNHGIDTESSYPYTGEDGWCHFRPSNVGATVRSIVDIESGNEEQLKAAVATVGPVSVAIDASHKSFQWYSGGVYYEEYCSTENLDHAVLVVGYGTDEESGEDYWLVKNSWGESWGDNGYIKMARNKGNNCGIATQASYPLV